MKNLSFEEFPIPDTALAEQNLLTALVGNAYMTGEAMKVLDDAAFTGDDARQVWNYLTSMFAKGEHTDAATLYAAISTEWVLKNILFNSTEYTDREIMGKIMTLAELSLKRRAYAVSLHVIQECVSSSPSSAVIQYMTEFLEEVARKRSEDSEKISKIMNDLGDILSERNADEAAGKKGRKPTSFSTFDVETAGGFADGNLVVLAARPSVGKTAVALQMAKASAVSGIPVTIWSLEMSSCELAQRFLQSESRMTSAELAVGNVDWPVFEEISGRFANLPLWVNDKPQSLYGLLSSIRMAHRRGQCNIAFVDYLGLIASGDRNMNRYELTGEATRSLKLLAKECRIPVVLLCQLNRASVTEGREPELYDIRDSGSIEQDADIVLMLHRQEGDNRLKILMRKNRQGKLTSRYVTPNETYTKFTEDDGGAEWRNPGLYDEEEV